MKKPARVVGTLLIFSLALACSATPAPTQPSATETSPATSDATEVPNSEPQRTEVPPLDPRSLSASDVSGILWQWVELIETDPASEWVVPDPENYTLVLDTSGGVSIQADCNLLGGTYSLGGDLLSIQSGPPATALCGDESLDQLYLASITSVESAGLDNDRLVLYLKDGAGQLEFYNGGPAGVPASIASPSDITGVVWRWSELVESEAASQSIVLDPQNYTLVFAADGEVGIKADCNHVLGSYVFDGDSLGIEIGPSTLASCGEESLDQSYLAYLGGVGSASAEGGRLVLHLDDSAEYMVFVKSGPVEEDETVETLSRVTATPWRWTELAVSEPVSRSLVADSVNYTLVFSPDGEIRIGADCNQVRGTYAFEGDALNLQFGPSTTAFCGEESLDQRFLALLGEVASAGFQDGRLVLSLVDGAGEMLFDQGGERVSGVVGIDPKSIALDIQGLPYSWQANLVPATPYDDTQPQGSVGLPEHLQVNFRGADAAITSPNDPVIYIIPTEAYELLWSQGEDPSVTIVLDDLEAMLAEQAAIPASGMLALPFEELGGVNDLAVSGQYQVSGVGSGLRFVGRFVEELRPVTNDGLRYVFQGFSADGQYLIAFFYPVTSSALPLAEEITPGELQRLESDLGAYLEEKVEMLSAQGDAGWNPDLSTLDSVLASLTFQITAPGSGIAGVLWEWEHFTGDDDSELAVEDVGSYTLTLGADGRLDFQADCDSGSGTFSLQGSSLMLELEPAATSVCGEDSLHDQYLQMLGSVGAFIVDEGRLVLNLQASAGNMIFTDGGPAPQP
jgi:heat shock protein HslJ